MRPLIVILFSLLTVTAFSQKKKSDSAPLSAFDQQLNSAIKLAMDEQYETAEQAFEELIKKEPGKGDIYFFYGETIIKDYLSDTISNSMKDMSEKANVLFKKGIQLDASNVLNQIGLGSVCLLRSSDTIAADKFFVLAEASLPLKQKLLTPRHALILTKLGSAQLLGKVNRHEKAIAYLSRAKEIDPENPSIYLAMGDVYITQNDGKNALASYNRALSLDPKSPLPKIKIGNIYMRAPNLNAARPYFQEARDIDSTYAPVYRSLGELYTMAGQHVLAKTNFRKFLDFSGNNTPAKIQYANALYRTKDYVNALQTIEEVLAVDKSRNYLFRLAAYCCYDKNPPELEKGRTYMEAFFKNTNQERIMPKDYVYLSHILFKVAKNDSLTLLKAFDAFGKAFAMDSTNVNLASEIASNYYFKHWYKDAIKWFNIKNKLGKTDKEDLMQIGKSYYQLKEFTKADSVFSKVIADQPDNMQAYVWLARTSSSMDPSAELGLAKPKFETVIEKVGTENAKYIKELEEAYKYMGSYYFLKKDYPNAKSWNKKLFELDPSNKELQIKALQTLALISQKEKNYVEARDYYIELKKLDPANADYSKIIKEFTKTIDAIEVQKANAKILN